MEKHKSTVAKSLALGIIIVAIMACFSIESLSVHEKQSTAKTMASGDMFILVGPSPQQGGTYSSIVGTSETWNCDVQLPPGPYTYSNVTIKWQIQTGFDTTVYSYGAHLEYVYYTTGTYSINVTMEANDLTRNQTKHIDLQVLEDFDHDGIPDWWEREYFGSTNAVDNTTDYDHDGWTDLQEYQKGTNPKVWTYKAGFLDEYWWAIAAIAAIILLAVLYIFAYRPRMERKRKSQEQKKIAAAVEIEKTLMSIDEFEEKGKK